MRDEIEGKNRGEKRRHMWPRLVQKLVSRSVQKKKKSLMRTRTTRNTRDRSITHSLKRWVSTKSSIWQLECIFFIIPRTKHPATLHWKPRYSPVLLLFHLFYPLLPTLGCPNDNLPLLDDLKKCAGHLLKRTVFYMFGSLPGVFGVMKTRWSLLWDPEAQNVLPSRSNFLMFLVVRNFSCTVNPKFRFTNFLVFDIFNPCTFGCFWLLTINLCPKSFSIFTNSLVCRF